MTTVPQIKCSILIADSSLGLGQSFSLPEQGLVFSSHAGFRKSQTFEYPEKPTLSVPVPGRALEPRNGSILVL